MSASEEQKIFIAKFCLSRDIARRVPPPFLRRNIETVLDAHERLVGRRANELSPEPMRPNGRRAAVFEWPAESALDALVHKPVMRINALQIRKLKGSSSSQWQNPRKQSIEDALDWLPDPMTGLILSCRLKVDMVAKTQPGVWKHTTSLETMATIAQCRTDDDDHFFDITLHEPLSIPVDRLFTEVHGNHDGDLLWEHRMAEKYTMEMTFHWENSEAGGKFLGMLEARLSSDFTGLPSHDVKVKAGWSDLPDCPRHQLLQLVRLSDHKVVPLQYGLDVQMGWPKKRATPLEMHNQAVALANGQLTSMKPSQAPCSSETIVRYCYNIQNGADTLTRVKTRDKLTCLFCGHCPAFRDAARLLGHYNLFHRQFRWALVGHVVGNGDAEIITVSMRMPQEGSGDDESDEDRETEFQMVNGQEPFDLRAYNAGDRSWAKNSILRVPRESSAAPVPTLARQRGRLRKIYDSDTASASPVSVAAPPTSTRRPALDEVADLPAVKRKKHTVPDVPGVAFYHSLSKQLMNPGEEFSESDDELYDDRLTESQRVSMLELGLSSQEQNFCAAFNRHMDVERSGSLKFIREGLVRFTRTHLKQLQHPVWRRTLVKRLEHMVAHRVVDSDVMEYCMNLMTENANPGADQLESEPDLTGPRDGGDSAVELVNGKARVNVVESTMRQPDSNNSSLRQKIKSYRSGGTGGDDQRAEGRNAIENRSCAQSNGNAKTRSRYDSSIGVIFVRTEPDSHEALNRRARSPSRSTAPMSVSAPRASKSSGHRRVTGDSDQMNQNGFFPESVSAARTSREHRRGTGGSDQMNQNGVRPIALQSVICWRHGDDRHASKIYRVHNFAKDVAGREPSALEPRHISFKRFLNALQEDVGFDRRLDIITHLPPMQDAGYVRDSADWNRCLTLCRDRGDELEFEIRRVEREPGVEAQANGRIKTRVDDKVLGHHSAAQASDTTSPVKEQVEPAKGLCICGQRVHLGRGTVACENLGCKRQRFHLSCVGLGRPSMEWRCGDCTATKDT